MTPQQRKALWIVGGVIVTAYVGRSVIESARQASFYQQQAIRAAQARAIAQAQKPLPAPSAVAAAPNQAPSKAASAISASYLGVWRGGTATRDRGMCQLRLEVHEKTPGLFVSYYVLACAQFAPQMSRQETKSVAVATLNRALPAEAVLLGEMQENGDIHFKVDKTIETNINGCAPETLTLTPFGTNRIAAQWTEQGCEGAHAILGRARQ